VIELQKERQVTADKLKADPRISAILSMNKERRLLRVIESPWMPMSLEEEVKQIPDRYLNRNNLYKRAGCDNILNNIVATPSGKMGICCGLTRELIPELNTNISSTVSVRDAYLKASKDFMKIWLRVEGPEKILAWAASKDPTIQWEGKYAHHCHACLALFSDEKVRNIIRERYKEKVEEVIMLYSSMIEAKKLLKRK
jgi:hypothetical protein